MIPTRRFKPIAGTAVQATDTAAHAIGGDTSNIRCIRLAWSGGPGHIVFGGSGVNAASDTTNRLYLPTAAGTDMFCIDGTQTHWAVTTGITAQTVVGT